MSTLGKAVALILSWADEKETAAASQVSEAQDAATARSQTINAQPVNDSTRRAKQQAEAASVSHR